jgi:hypothetical protein
MANTLGQLLCRGDGPPPQGCGSAGVQAQIDYGGRYHSAYRCKDGQDAPGPSRELPVDELPLDQPPLEEEDGHQPIVYPVKDAERTEVGVKGGEVGRGQS